MKSDNTGAIAVIGIAGRFPGAEDAAALWKELRAGRSAVTAMPERRRPAGLSAKTRDESARMGQFWGGFIDDADGFDAAFFGISAREAAAMDPQQRMALELAWAAIEDAGYTAASLAGSQTAVLMGVCHSDYVEIHEQESASIDSYYSTGIAYSIIANRISHFFDFRGASVVNDTACASSLVAVQQAVEALRRNECTLALAGGVNVCWSVNHYLAFTRNGMLSRDGRCRTFDASANGYVRGEGGGIVVLKALERARRDGDHIHGIIKGIGSNHGGRTNSLTATNPAAQADLLEKVISDSGIPPETISYIETHGTGTPLGDPIEIHGLQTAFQRLAERTGGSLASWTACGLGSIKTNIGHLEAAAGIAGMIKVLACMRHKALPATLNFDTLNTLIELEGTPFYITDRAQDWNPELKGQTIPRRAGVSSFGFGGVNAHVVLEEYVEVEAIALRDTPAQCCVVLSAKTRTALIERARQLRASLIDRDYTHRELAAVARTLQMGREPMSYRLGLIVETRDQLMESLRAYVAGEAPSPVLRGPVLREGGPVAERSTVPPEQTLDKDLTEHNWERVLESWVQGANVDWSKAHDAADPRRVSLPTYPFERKRHWVESGRQVAERAPSLHPLLHANRSGVDGMAFESSFTGDEFFLADHVVNGRKVLPGVAHLEMAHAAVQKLSRAGTPCSRITNVTFIRQLAVDKPQDVRIQFERQSEGDLRFQVHVISDNDEPLLCSQGRVQVRGELSTSVVDVAELRSRCGEEFASRDRCYELFATMGIRYGAGHRALASAKVGKGQRALPEILARIELPESVRESHEAFYLHPSILDAALQTSMLFPLLSGGESSDSPRLMIPFSLSEARVVCRCPMNLWAWLRFSEDSGPADANQRLDIALFDDAGRVCVELKGFTSRAMVVGAPRNEDSGAAGPLLLTTEWRLETGDFARSPAQNANQEHQVLLVGSFDERQCERIRAGLPEAIACAWLGAVSDEKLDERFQRHAIELLTRLRKILQSRPAHPVLLQLVVGAEGEADSNSCLSALSGMLKTASLENSKLLTQCIQISPSMSPESVVEMLTEQANGPTASEVRTRDGLREVKHFAEIAAVVKSPGAMSPWRDDGVYLITGGSGGLGLTVADAIARQTQRSKLVLTGRSALTSDKLARLSQIEALGATMDFHELDVAEPRAMRRLVELCLERQGGVNGIIHCAGVIHDSLIVTKTVDELRRVFAPKVRGLLSLDEATRHLDLEFLILFSSTAGAFGNLGQADYAAANAFMDRYAAHRNQLVDRGERRGRTISINWPLWAHGGMQVDEAVMTRLRRGGVVPLSTADGLSVLTRCRSANSPSQVIVVSGSRAQIDIGLRDQSAQQKPADPSTGAAAVVGSSVDAQLFSALEGVLGKMVTGLLKVSATEAGVEDDLGKLGLDSISFTELTNQVNERYRLDLMPTIFFEYSTLQRFSEHLVKNYPEQLAAAHGIAEVTHSVSLPSPSHNKPYVSVERDGPVRETAPAAASGQEPIAIIGMSCCFPKARNVEEFWDNLLSGRDCISEVPASRWDWKAIYGDANQHGNQTRVKWGGFIDGIEEFDPLFFGISPKEAELMDPQQRLLMTHVWRAIEDAGYAPAGMAGTNTAVFVGLQANDYVPTADLNSTVIESYSSTSRIPAVGPNRVSYFFDLHGPSEPIDTACSSALVAIHRALRCLRDGECEQAVVGGINTIVRPDYHISFSKAGMLCEDGQCKTFSKNANGYVRGEGVGILLLKKLSAAERDGDHIYATLDGSAENHGGRANSLTAPNPKAQADLIKTAFREAKIDPRTVTYIEAHGTGTPLGDPIEINALKSAFAELSQGVGDVSGAGPYCGIASVKTNIGHLELAAGVAGVIKVLLQIKHRTLVKSLNCEEINPYIKLENSPFYIVRANEPWRAQHAADGRALPRRAGVSSFGFGGANAHVVITEYLESGEEGAPRILISAEHPALIVLSAKNEERLREQVGQLLAHTETLSDADLGNVAYTLQVGREAMEHRLAFTATTLDELRSKLRAYAEGEPQHAEVEGGFRGNTRKNREMLSALIADADFADTVDKWVRSGKYSKLLNLWVKGLPFEWERLYGGRANYGGAKPRRMSLPTYPFSREQYWTKSQEAPRARAEADRRASVSASAQHPLLQTNTSTLSEQRFSTELSGAEFFLRDHVVSGVKVLPGVCYLEMARAAVVVSAVGGGAGMAKLRLKSMVWQSPIVVEASRRVHIGLQADDRGGIEYEVYTDAAVDEGAGPARVIHAQGRAVVSEAGGTEEPLDLDGLRAGCHERLDASRCYAAWRARGIEYGASHRALQSVSLGRDSCGARYALAALKVPEIESETGDGYVLHPSMLDSALQASIGWSLEESTPREEGWNKPLLPFALEELEILARSPAHGYAYLRAREHTSDSAPSRKLDVDICDEQGRICVRLKGLTSRPLEGSLSLKSAREFKRGRAVGSVEVSSGAEVARAVLQEQELTQGRPGSSSASAVHWLPCWDVVSGAQGEAWPSRDARVLLVGGTVEHRRALGARYGHLQCIELSGTESIAELVERIGAHGVVEHVLWFTPMGGVWPLSDERLIRDQATGVLSGLRLIKALLQLGYESRALGWTALTWQTQRIEADEAIAVTHSSIAGLVGSLAKEYGHWQVRLIDVPLSGECPLEELLRVPADPHGDACAYRSGEWYRQQLVPCELPAVSEVPYRRGGVYVVIGGAGGLGEVLSEHLIRTYQAQMVWIGRRGLDATIQGKLDRLGALGPAPMYVSADAADRGSLEGAYRRILARHGEVHGVVHAAIALLDKSLAQMDEDRFKAALSAKVDVSVRLGQVFGQGPLEWVLFFSSLQSFSKAGGQSNYAAGCTFKDGFAQQLSRVLSCPVKVMNWGYWGSIGIVASSSYRARMARQGIGSIEPEEGMAALERLLCAPVNQAVFMKTTPPGALVRVQEGSERISTHSEVLNGC